MAPHTSNPLIYSTILYKKIQSNITPLEIS
nr:MAG TPA: hypothetical protein [Caudoviricetes sp.]